MVFHGHHATQSHRTGQIAQHVCRQLPRAEKNIQKTMHRQAVFFTVSERQRYFTGFPGWSKHTRLQTEPNMTKSQSQKEGSSARANMMSSTVFGLFLSCVTHHELPLRYRKHGCCHMHVFIKHCADQKQISRHVMFPSTRSRTQAAANATTHTMFVTPCLQTERNMQPTTPTA